MTLANQLAAKLEHLNVAEGMPVIEAFQKEALYFDVIGDAMCIMHPDGSVSIVEHSGAGAVTIECISSLNVLKVLQHYRPFKEVFKSTVQ